VLDSNDLTLDRFGTICKDRQVGASADAWAAFTDRGAAFADLQVHGVGGEL
jgi:hypothetical protein